MKKFVLLPLAALAIAAACNDNTLGPAPVAVAPSGPLKDEIYNNVDTSIDAVAEVMALNVGSNGTTELYVSPTNGDGKEGCNLTGNTTLGLSISSSNTGVATVSPSSVTFESCGDTKLLTITPVAAGSATISVAQTANGTKGTFNLDPATFTVNVTAATATNTAPKIAVLDVTGGASYNKGAVPVAMCQVTDPEDQPSPFAATLSAITGVYASDGIGSQTASCNYTDKGDLQASASETYSIVDAPAPVIVSTLDPASPNGINGWYKTGNVTLTWSVSEPQSPNSLQKTGCLDQTITTDQDETYSCSAESAGGSVGPVSVLVKRDATDPTISGQASSGTSWTKDDVTVEFTCTDATSGVASCEPDETVSSEGANQSVSGSATDNAGNSAITTVTGINIDKTPPTVALVGGPASGGSYYFGSVPAAPTCNASDALSGLAGACQVSGYRDATGTQTVTATVTNNAGNTNSTSANYTVLAWTLKGFYSPVDMNGVVNTVKAGSTVPLKFEVFAGSELTSTGAIKAFSAVRMNCTTGSEDAIEEVSPTGGTSLRYDTTAGQFIQNWKTPTGAGTCYRVTMTTQDESAPLTALFKLK